jgi:hypothetical protein
MDSVYYLIHAMDRPYNKDWTELKTSSINNADDQFPGVFLSLITKDNIKNEGLYSYKTLMIFSKKLLEQQNYHINIHDYNGFINEKNTYFPWQLDKAVRKIKNIYKKTKHPLGNEVIFHDPIPMKYLCAVITINSIHYEIRHKINYTSLFLPKYEIYNEEPPDMTKLPFYCMPFEDYYTGYNKYKLSSPKFYKKMAVLCDVNKNQSRKKIIKEITAKLEDLYYNRDKQKLEEFKKLFLK